MTREELDEEECEIMNTYIDSLERENKHFRKVLKNIYAICTFKNGKEYNDSVEQIFDISEILGLTRATFFRYLNKSESEIEYKEMNENDK